MRRPTAFHDELARRVLARQLELEPQARFVLRAWAGLVAPETSERLSRGPVAMSG